MTFKEWLIELFKDERKSTSVKPLIALLGAFFLYGSLVANAITGNQYRPADTLIDAVIIITAIGMGADTVDKFTKKSPKTTKEVKIEE